MIGECTTIRTSDELFWWMFPVRVFEHIVCTPDSLITSRPVICVNHEVKLEMWSLHRILAVHLVIQKVMQKLTTCTMSLIRVHAYLCNMARSDLETLMRSCLLSILYVSAVFIAICTVFLAFLCIRQILWIPLHVLLHACRAHKDC